jgi:hypothetical protein
VILVRGIFGPLGQSDHPPDARAFLIFGGTPIVLLLLAMRLVPWFTLRFILATEALLIVICVAFLW